MASPAHLPQEQAHKVRNIASLHAHRAQVLNQRRNAIRSSAKRW